MVGISTTFARKWTESLPVWLSTGSENWQSGPWACARALEHRALSAAGETCDRVASPRGVAPQVEKVPPLLSEGCCAGSHHIGVVERAAPGRYLRQRVVGRRR